MRGWPITAAAVVFALVPGLSATAQTAQAPATIATVAGTGVDGQDGDGGPATSAAHRPSAGIAVRRAEASSSRRRSCPPCAASEATAASRPWPGREVAGFSGDGGPATAAQLNLVHGVALLPDGSMVLADTSNHRIRRVAPNGTITTVAGTGTFGFSGDGGPATSAQIAAPRGIATLPDGSILFPDSGNHRVRRISPTGVITTVAGNGTSGFSGDGGPAPRGPAQPPVRRITAPGDTGGFLIADAGNSRIRRVAADGTITTVATQLSSPHAVAALPDGGFLVADTNNNRVTRSAPDGTATTVAGIGTAGFSGDGGPAAAAALNQPKALAVLPDLSGFLVGDSANNRVRLVRLDLRPAARAARGRQAAPHDGRSCSHAALHALRAGHAHAWRWCGAAPSSCA